MVATLSLGLIVGSVGVLQSHYEATTLLASREVDSRLCPEIADRRDLRAIALSNDDRASLHCFMIDDSHPTVLSAIGGACADYYTTDDASPSAVKLCYSEGGKCKASKYTMHCSNAILGDEAAPLYETLQEGNTGARPTAKHTVSLLQGDQSSVHRVPSVLLPQHSPSLVSLLQARPRWQPWTIVAAISAAAAICVGLMCLMCMRMHGDERGACCSCCPCFHEGAGSGAGDEEGGTRFVKVVGAVDEEMGIGSSHAAKASLADAQYPSTRAALELGPERTGPPVRPGWTTPLQHRAALVADVYALCVALSRWRTSVHEEARLRVGPLVGYMRYVAWAMRSWVEFTDRQYKHAMLSQAANVARAAAALRRWRTEGLRAARLSWLSSHQSFLIRGRAAIATWAIQCRASRTRHRDLDVVDAAVTAKAEADDMTESVAPTIHVQAKLAQKREASPESVVTVNVYKPPYYY